MKSLMEEAAFIIGLLADSFGLNDDNAHNIAKQIMKTIDKMPGKRRLFI